MFNLGFSSKSGKSTTNANSNSDTHSTAQSDPWDLAIPQLKDYLAKLGAAGGIGATDDQNAAFTTLKANAADGNPWTTQISGLTTDLFNTADRSGQVGEYLGALQGQLGDVANGKYLDPMSNPQMAAMLAQVGNDTQSRINQMFAGAGRDMSGANQKAVASGVTAAQLPILVNQYNQERAAQADAAAKLYGAGSDATATQSNLDAARAQLRSAGVDTASAALDAENYGANKTLELEQQLKMLPYEDLGTLGSLLFQVAGLGGQQVGDSNTKTNSTSTTKSKQSGFSLGFGL